MKLAKMSLIAALALSTSVYAIDNVKVNGDVKVYYGTWDSDAEGADDMFGQDVSYADTALHLGLTADLSEGVSAGVSVTAVSTLGLENNLVGNTWSNSHQLSNSRGSSFVGGSTGTNNSNRVEDLQADDAMWVDEIWIAGTAYDTTLKMGRQQLDTPLAFTETWGIDTNTFEAIVGINQSIPDTTLVATYIGKSNGVADDEEAFTLFNVGRSQAGYVAQDGKFNTFGSDGVYAYGVINNSFKPLTFQAWYYDMQSLAKAYWLQADIKCSLLPGLLIGAQYANTDADDLVSLAEYANPLGGALDSAGNISGVDDTSMYSVMLGYEIKDVVTIKGAFSSVSDDGTLGMANTATGSAATIGGQSKMYTEKWWNYGIVSAVGSDSYSITAETTVGPEVDLFLGYYYSDVDPQQNSAVGGGNVLVQDKYDIDEVTFTASKSFGPLDTSVAIIWQSMNDKNSYPVGVEDGDEDVTSLQVYLTYNF